MHQQHDSGQFGVDPERVDAAAVPPESHPASPERGRGYVCRPDERDAIAKLAAEERDDALLIAGPTGSGRTFLLRNAHRTLDVASHFVQGSPAERDWVYSGISTVLTLLLADTAPTVLAEIVEGIDQPTAVLGARVLTVIRDMQLTPTVLLIDDVDIMDEASQRLIAFLARRLTGTGLRLICTLQQRPSVGPFAGISCRELAPLEHGRALGLVKELGGGDIHPAVALAVIRYSSGYPQTIREMLEAIGPAQLIGKVPILLPLRPGPGTTAAVEKQLTGISEGARAALNTLSIAPSLPANTPGLSGRATDELHDAQLIQRVGPSMSITQHRVRVVVYWQLAPEERTAEHQALGDALAEVDPLLARWQHSFGASSPTMAALLATVPALVRRGDQVAALELAARALCLGHPGVEEALLMVDAAALFLTKGNFSAAKGLITLAGLATDEPRVQIRVATLQVRIAFLERRELLDGLVRAAVAIFGHAEPLRTRALLDLAAASAAELWLIDLARQWWGEADELARDEEAGKPESVVKQQSATDQRQVEGGAGAPGAPGELDASAVPGGPAGHEITGVVGYHEAVGHYLASLAGSGDQKAPVRPPIGFSAPTEVLPVLLHARGLTFAEQYGAARGMLAMAGQLPTLTVLDEATRLLFTLDNELRAGNLHLAAEAVRQVEAGVPDVHPSLRAYLLARFWSELGEPKPVAHWVGIVSRLSSTGHGAALAARMQATLGRAHLMEGRHDEAIRLLGLADRSGARFPNPLLVGHEADLIEALAVGGHPDRAADVLARFNHRLELTPSRWGTLVLGRCRAFLLGGRHGVSALRRHLDAWPNTDANGHRYDYEYYRSLFALGQLHDNLDQHAEAKDAFSRAVAGFEGIGQDGWVSSIRRRFLVTGASPEPARHPAFGQLSPNERLVVEKVLSGKRNRDIAEELFVSLRTVEVRLTSVYRRLGVQSRAQLMALLNGGERGAGRSGAQ